MKRIFVSLFVFGVVACSSTGGQLGENTGPIKTEYRPLAKFRPCTDENDCAAVDTDCTNACPGGGAINKRYLDKFRRDRAAACKAIRTAPPSEDRVCVTAPVICRLGQCTWVYQGPDPRSL